MERVEFCMQYSEGFVEDKWYRDEEAEYQSGLKTRVMDGIAKRVWTIPLVKEVGFVFRDQGGKGDTYHYVHSEVRSNDGRGRGPRGHNDGTGWWVSRHGRNKS